jgi:Glycosyl hydrolase family 115/Gylcosyl hydrolase family 115 C-terminal domain
MSVRFRPLRLLIMVAVLAVTGLTGAPAASARPGGPAVPGPGPATLTDTGAYIAMSDGPGRFPLVAHGSAAPVVVSTRDYPGVVRVAGDLQTDLRKVSGVRPAIATDQVPRRDEVVLVGTIGRSPLIDALVASGKLDVRGIAGRWETSLEAVVANPMPGVRRAFVIAGSDQRGTIYGAYDVSRGIGVSPWYYWDDVRPAHHDALFVLPGAHTQGTPKVRYRGIFINDENPSLGTWAPATFGPGLAPGFPGGFNATFYARVFETMLRLKANYLWPAVWGRAFNEDDPANQATATAYGIVMGTSHEAPMMRGIEEWNRHAVPAVRDAAGNITTPGSDPYGGTGEWSFRRNGDAIQAYWTDGIRRMVRDNVEGIVTIGMRGNGDVSLPDGDGIDLMRQITTTEREIIGKVTGRNPATVPQVWTLYKEVQRYWDAGLRVPDDVTVMFTDDNWGNTRKLPDLTMAPRGGGYGLYTHFDYVGGGRDYKWVDTTSLPNLWDQLHQAVGYGVDRLWMANVGDLKNNELPTQYYLDYAWNPDRWQLDRIPEWESRYAAENFGSAPADAIAAVLAAYARLQAQRKPELLNRKITLDPARDLRTDPAAVVYDDQASPFSLTDYQELDGVTARWQALRARADTIGRALPAAARDAYYELVRYEVDATANVYALRDAEFTNILYARQGRAATNRLAALAEARFADDQAMSDYYNHRLAAGKWNGFQLQPHIDYGDIARYGPNAPWQQPELNNVALPDVIFPAVRRITVPHRAELGVAIDGSADAWPGAAATAVLPEFSQFQTAPAQFVDVFNRGSVPYGYRISPAVPWLRVSAPAGVVRDQVRATLSVDWVRAPQGTTRVPITVTGAGRGTLVWAVVSNPRLPRLVGFVEGNGYVAMDADHFTAATAGGGGPAWARLPGIGRTGSGMEPFPVTAASQAVGAGPRLDYQFTTASSGPVRLLAYLSPRNNVLHGSGIRYAVAIDDAMPRVVDITTESGADDTAMNRQWERDTSDNVNLTVTAHTLAGAGPHVLHVWMVDPTVVLQRFVIDTGGLRPSYLGPPESRRF